MTAVVATKPARSRARIARARRSLRLPDVGRALRGLLRRAVERRLGDYRQQIAWIDPSAALGPPPRHRCRVCVIGGGIAGITAASALSSRGFRVTLLEAKEGLGGMLGSSRARFADGFEAEVDHGFHAFFRNYYNLSTLLERTGVRDNMRSIDDYLIRAQDGKLLRFSDLDRPPLLNLLSMARRGMFRWSDLLANRRTRDNLDALLRYDATRTFADYDHISFAEFARAAALPRRLQLAFTSFARVFFAEERRLSMAELIKSFHFYFLSNDAGLIFDYPADDFDSALIGPLRDHLEQRGVALRLGRPVSAIEPRTDGSFDVDGERFAHVVLACGAAGARQIARSSPRLVERCPELVERLSALRPSQRYAVLRAWSDRSLRGDLPVFLITERARVLDAIAVVSRIGSSARRWVATHGGSVYELHCYAVPDELPDSEIGRLLLEEAERAFVELRGQRVRYEHLHIGEDFTAFHVGTGRRRPPIDTGVAGLYLAGDWVALPRPAMLMEAACMSAMLAANGVLASVGLRREPVYAVPARGVLADWPVPPKKYDVAGRR